MPLLLAFANVVFSVFNVINNVFTLAETQCKKPGERKEEKLLAHINWAKQGRAGIQRNQALDRARTLPSCLWSLLPTCWLHSFFCIPFPPCALKVAANSLLPDIFLASLSESYGLYSFSSNLENHEGGWWLAHLGSLVIWTNHCGPKSRPIEEDGSSPWEHSM